MNLHTNLLHCSTTWKDLCHVRIYDASQSQSTIEITSDSLLIPSDPYHEYQCLFPSTTQLILTQSAQKIWDSKKKEKKGKTMICDTYFDTKNTMIKTHRTQR